MPNFMLVSGFELLFELSAPLSCKSMNFTRFFLFFKTEFSNLVAKYGYGSWQQIQNFKAHFLQRYNCKAKKYWDMLCAYQK